MKIEDIVEQMKHLPRWEKPGFLGRQIAQALIKQKDDVFLDLLKISDFGALVAPNKKLKDAVTGMTNKQIDILFNHQKKEKLTAEGVFLPFLFLSVDGATPPKYLIDKTREVCQDKETSVGQNFFGNRQLILMEKFDNTPEGRKALLDFEFQKSLDYLDTAVSLFFNGSDELSVEYMKKKWPQKVFTQILRKYLLDIQNDFTVSPLDEKTLNNKPSSVKINVLMSMIQKETDIPPDLNQAAYLLYKEGRLPPETHETFLPFFKDLPAPYKSYCIFLTGAKEVKDLLTSSPTEDLRLTQKNVADILTRYISRKSPKISKEDVDHFVHKVIAQYMRKEIIMGVLSSRSSVSLDFKAVTHLTDFLDQASKLMLAQDMIIKARSWSLPDKRVIKHLIRECPMETIREVIVPPELQEWWAVVSIKKTKKEIKGALEGALKQKVSQPKRRM